MIKCRPVLATLSALIVVLLVVACQSPPAASPTVAPAAAAKPTVAAAAPPATTPAASAPVAGPATGKPIKVGFVGGITGTASGSFVGPFSQGSRAYYEWVNANGGVNGRPIQLIEVDDKYQVPLAVDGYKKVKSEGVVFSMIEGTPKFDALSAQVNEDKIPAFTTGGPALAADVKQNPYWYTVNVIYPYQMMDILQYIKQTHKGTSPAKVAFVYADNPFGREPIGVGKETAQKLGFQVVDEEVMEINLVDATQQMLKLKSTNPDFVIIQHGAPGGAAIVRDAKKVGVTAQLIGLNYAFDDTVVAAAGAAAEGYVGVAAVAFPTDDLPVVKEMKERAPKLEIKQASLWGWTYSKVVVTALGKAGAEPTSASFKAALEALGPMDVGGATPDWGYTSDRHFMTDKVVLYTVKGGKIVPLTGTISPPKF